MSKIAIFSLAPVAVLLLIIIYILYTKSKESKKQNKLTKPSEPPIVSNTVIQPEKTPSQRASVIHRHNTSTHIPVNKPSKYIDYNERDKQYGGDVINDSIDIITPIILLTDVINMHHNNDPIYLGNVDEPMNYQNNNPSHNELPTVDTSYTPSYEPTPTYEAPSYTPTYEPPSYDPPSYDSTSSYDSSSSMSNDY